MSIIHQGGRVRTLQACPVCGYSDALSLTEKQGRLLAYCHAGNCDFKEIARALDLGIQPPERPALAPKPPNVQIEAYIQQLWGKAQPAKGTLVEAYLQGRGLALPEGVAIRFLPEAKHTGTGQTYPAMVSRVQCPHNRPALHRVYLTHTGHKAPITPNKKTLGEIRAGAVHIGEPVEGTLGIAEGVESALAAHQMTGLPVWACLNTAGMVGVQLPPHVTELFIFADHDPPGLKAAFEASQRFARQGLIVRVIKPPSPGWDMNDWLKGGAA